MRYLDIFLRKIILLFMDNGYGYFFNLVERFLRNIVSFAF